MRLQDKGTLGLPKIGLFLASGPIAFSVRLGAICSNPRSIEKPESISNAKNKVPGHHAGRDAKGLRRGSSHGMVEYVIAHELVHLHESHHTPDFWQRLERAMPDFVARKQWLAEHALNYTHI